jgi:cytochrome c oxidase subunit 2
MSVARVFHSMLAPATPQAKAIESLWWTMLWITGVVTVLVLILFFAAIAFRRGANRPAASGRALTIAVSSGATLTLLILFVLLADSVWTGHVVASVPEQNAVPVQIIGHQWWWEIVYPGTIPANQVATANEIHLPTGRPLALSVSSRDVIHSFWAPNLLGKRDLIPGYSTGVWLQIDRAGVYHGQCAEYCGRQHARMGFDVVAESDHEFEEWLADERRPAEEPLEPLPIAGREVFMGTRCSACHTIRGTAAAGSGGPDLTHFASRAAIGASARPNTPKDLREWIANPHDAKPGNQMPANPLGDRDLTALVDYIEGLK